METISSNHFSHDQQVMDVMEFLELNDGVAYAHLMNMFPELYNVAWDGSWLDTVLMGVDVEFTSWLCDEIEACTTVMWLEGEPFFMSTEDFNTDPDEFFDGWWGSTDDDTADLSLVELTS